MKVAGIDVYCGAGGLSCGLQRAGVKIVAGIDVDQNCNFPFTHNIKSTFINSDVRDLNPDAIGSLYPRGAYRLLAGCAPCRPFSKYRCGTDPSEHSDWGLLAYFTKLVSGILPEFVTMENVPELESSPVFTDFLDSLMRNEYSVDIRVVYCPQLGIPQKRKRLVLLASKIGDIAVPVGSLSNKQFKTVRDCISKLPSIKAGESDSKDPMHKARKCTPLNLKRLQSSRPGGTWRDWPIALRSPCHRKKSGSTFPSVYSRMKWDEPSPTITTQAFNFGTGRFGHPEQNRSLSLRECALLQTFPLKYQFVPPGDPIRFEHVGKLIGNAVPPKLGYCIGRAIMRVVDSQFAKGK